MSIVSLVLAPTLSSVWGTNAGHGASGSHTESHNEVKDAPAAACDYSNCANMTPEQCKAYCDSLGCSSTDREKCISNSKGDKETSMAACEKNCEMACLNKEECAKNSLR